MIQTIEKFHKKKPKVTYLSRTHISPMATSAVVNETDVIYMI